MVPRPGERLAPPGRRFLAGFHRAEKQFPNNLTWKFTGETTFCIYLAKDEETIRRHAELSGIPVSTTTEGVQTSDPLVANN